MPDVADGCVKMFFEKQLDVHPCVNESKIDRASGRGGGGREKSSSVVSFARLAGWMPVEDENIRNRPRKTVSEPCRPWCSWPVRWPPKHPDAQCEHLLLTTKILKRKGFVCLFWYKMPAKQWRAGCFSPLMGTSFLHGRPHHPGTYRPVFDLPCTECGPDVRPLMKGRWHDVVA